SIPPKAISAARRVLERALGGKARVMTMKQAIVRGLVGFGRPSARFLRRTGTMLVLPKRGHHVWYRFHGLEFNQKGSHGGLSEDEMIVPLAIAQLSDLL